MSTPRHTEPKKTPIPEFIANNLPLVKLQNRVLIYSGLICIALYFLRSMFLMRLFILAGVMVVNMLLWMLLLTRLECPNCKQSLRYLGGVLEDVRYCPFCGCKYLK